MADSTITTATDTPAGAAMTGLTGIAPKIHRRYCAVETFDSKRLGDAWLGRRERAELATWRDQRRRCAWLLGRMLAKQLIATLLSDDLPATAIEILSRDSLGRVNRPRVWCEGTPRSWSLSISHSDRGVLVALSTDDYVSLGVDVAQPTQFSDAFVELWFTTAERDWFRDTHSASIACFIWAAKEALYKACNEGESFAPRNVEVLPDGRCSYRQAPVAGCHLQSWTVDSHLAVLASVTKQPFTNPIIC